jgi:hypothetical protein
MKQFFFFLKYTLNLQSLNIKKTHCHCDSRDTIYVNDIISFLLNRRSIIYSVYRDHIPCVAEHHQLMFPKLELQIDVSQLSHSF